MRILLTTSIIGAIVSGVPASSQAALNAYLKLTGQRQGLIKGDVTQKGREGLISGFEFKHEIISPRDAASGLPTGKRQHKPFIFVAEVGQAYPALLTALSTNETLQAEFLFFRPSLTATTTLGSEVQFMSIKLTNATLSSVSLRSANNKDPNLARLPEMVEIGFTYQRIDVQNLTTGKSYTDTWSAPVASVPEAAREARLARWRERPRRAARK
jgi:type VI secretion system secreted protein Hcp